MAIQANTQIVTKRLTDLKLALGYQDIIWVSGQVFLFRDFVRNADEYGLDAIFEACPYGDLDEGQRVTFTACFHNPRLREIVARWWTVYDEERAVGNIPAAGDFWLPAAFRSEDADGVTGGYQDIIRLAGLVFLRRSFVKSIDRCGLQHTFTYESAYGDLDDKQRATFTACFHNPHLRKVVEQWWAIYDEERVMGNIPAVVDSYGRIFWE